MAIVGAGPAGLTAATYLTARGLAVTLVDEYYKVGGRLLGQRYEIPRKPAAERLWDGASIAADLEQQVRERGATILLGRTVWGVEPGWKLHLAPGPEKEVDARAVIIATGAAERAIPVPGWTLPGVMSIGAAQVFTNVHGVAPGRRVLVVGMDPLSLSITGEMIAAGVKVAAVVLPPPGPASGQLAIPADVIAQLAQASALAPSFELRMAGRLFGGRLRGLAARLANLHVLRAWGVPLHLRKALVEIVGDNSVQSVRLASLGPHGELSNIRELVDVDAVCISGGLYPLGDLVGVAGCPMVEIPQLGGQVPVHNGVLETPLEGLFVAGNVIGIEGAAVAVAQGRVAAASAARYLGVAPASAVRQDLEEALSDVSRARKSLPFSFLPDVVVGHRLMEALWQDRELVSKVQPPSSMWDEQPSDLVICRCEEITLGRILAAFEEGASAVPGVKKRTRAGMGRCQGRVCEPVLRRIGNYKTQGVVLPQRSRSPVRPVRLSEF